MLIAYLSRLADFVKFRKPLDVFSLNYDLSFETALHENGISFTNGFTSLGWNPAIFDNQADVRLFKLHGSLDWVENLSFGICSTNFPVHDRLADFEGEDPPLLIFGTNTKLTGRDPFSNSFVSFFVSHCLLRRPGCDRVRLRGRTHQSGDRAENNI